MLQLHRVLKVQVRNALSVWLRGCMQASSDAGSGEAAPTPAHIAILYEFVSTLIAQHR
jgi:hypothetical protein